MIICCSLGATLIAVLAGSARADDWPMFRADAHRSAFTPEELPSELEPAWAYRPDHAPALAWPQLARMTFDRAHQLAVTDGTLRLELRSPDDDGLGVAYRLQDESHHYLLHLDRQRSFRALARRDGDEYEVLALDREAYTACAWMKVELRLEGPSIRVSIDGRQVFRVDDERYQSGTLALHSWGSTGPEFRAIAFEPPAR